MSRQGTKDTLLSNTAHPEAVSFSAEIICPWERGDFDIRYALFDFDGTVSLIREGWQEIMIPYFCEVLGETESGESGAEIRRIVRRFVTDLTGKQTIFQCMRLNEEVIKRGGPGREPIVYKREYLRRLDERIRGRKLQLAKGDVAPEAWMVPGSKRFVRFLRQKGIRCYLASGTDEEDVLREAALLGVDDLFDGGIHGAHDAMVDCSKKLVIEDMIQREHIRPRELVSFGDGYVEVELIALLGGLPIGIATEEAARKGVNAWKRSRLIAAGARAILPDFSDPQAAFRAILEEQKQLL